MTSALSAFLARNSVIKSESLPLIHSTTSYNFRGILGKNTILPQPCDVFKPDKLTYFFVGRPAYKYESDNSSAEAWELPCCFIFEADVISDVKRIFPFDSGAFNNKRYPSYINSMPVEQFEVDLPDSPGKIIGSYFGSASRYFNLHPKPREEFEQEFSLTPFDAELIAAMRLAGEGTPTRFDDRRFTIEVQSAAAVDLGEVKPMAVILPDVYLDIDGVLERIQN